MDIDIAGWIIDFVLRQKLDDLLVTSICGVLPIPNDDKSLKKAMLIRTIESEISKNSVSEKILELLELIEELDHGDGIGGSEAMKAAYCAVAVDCTVRYLERNVNDKHGYFDAVKRIWRSRVCEMQRFEEVGLVSEEMQTWKDEIEAAVWDKVGRKNILGRSRKIDAVDAVRVYVAEEKETIGPSFLEFVAEKLSDDSLKEVLGLGSDISHEQIGERAENSPYSGEALADINNNTEPHMISVPSRRKHVANRQYRGSTSGLSRGVKIADNGHVGKGTSFNKYVIPPTPEVNKVQEALESSSLDLQAAVNDPLPEALQLADRVISSMGVGHVDHELAPNNHNKSDNVSEPLNDKNAQTVRDNDVNLGGQCCVNQHNTPKPSLMARNSTAQTYEWEDSIGDSPESSLNGRNRVHLPSPKRRIVSPLKKHEVKKLARRRKAKRWSTLEEDTLRTGVQKYGKGNWKHILDMYHDVFEERTEVDLKDKWRNMTRH